MIRSSRSPQNKRGGHSSTERPPLIVEGAPEIKRDEIEEGNVVGTGQFGQVYKGRCRGYQVAIKKLRERKSEDLLKSFKKEVEIMSRIRFPNVCLLLGACLDPTYFCIVQEFLPGGTLAESLEQGKLPPSFYSRMRLASHIARGMIWIHANGVIHRDLKLENLLLDKHYEVKVADFGLAEIIDSTKIIWDRRRKGSPLYMAPELLLKKAFDNRVDVYSFGIILWELLACKRAFPHHLTHTDINIFINAICNDTERPPVPPAENTSSEEWDNSDVIKLIKNCWDDNPNVRPDFQEIYDQLTINIIEGFIADPWGRSFWIVNFPDSDNVPWNEFINVLYCKKTIKLEDGSKVYRGLALKNKKDPHIEKITKCIKILLAQISGISKSNFDVVSCESFGKLLKWFGPGIEQGDGEKSTFLERVHFICSRLFFHGYLANSNILLQGSHRQFLLRLSPIPGSFTIQTPTKRCRVNYTPGSGYKPQLGASPDSKQDNQMIFKTCSDFFNWINDNMKNYQPLPNSDFSEVFGNHSHIENLYVPPSVFSTLIKHDAAQNLSLSKSRNLW